VSTEQTTSVQASPELKKRIVTAVFGVALLLALIIWAGSFGVGLIGAVIALAMMYEYVSITFTLPDKAEKRWVLLGVTWLVAFANFVTPGMEFELLLACFLGLGCYFLGTARRHPDPVQLGNHFREYIFAVFGVIYLAFLPLYLTALRRTGAGAHWVLIFLFIVWAGDTGAYFTGKKYGRTPLYPLISPKKTVEGAVGGLLSGLAVTVLYKLILFRGMSWGAAILIPLLVGAVAQIGDLVESFLKRSFDTKDSGSILPGHGGFLDRFDSVVFSLPVMYGCIRLLG
jgi:phosphatidate cytidylyltransferase